MRKAITIVMLSLMPLLAMAQWQGFGQFPGAPAGQQNQQQQFSPEAFKQFLEQFIREKAGLTQQEGQRFFPMLHEMMAKQRDVQNRIFANMRKGSNAKTEAEFERIINLNSELSIEDSKIELAYYKQFHKVLSWEKIYKVRNALYQFNMEALRKFSPTPQRRGAWQGPNNGFRGPQQHQGPWQNNRGGANK